MGTPRGRGPSVTAPPGAPAPGAGRPGLGALSRRHLLALSLAPALLAACGNQENLDDIPKTGLSEGKVIYSTWGTTARRETENWTLLAFEKNYSDLHVDVIWSPTPAEHVAKQVSLLSGGTPPDVMRLPSWSAPTFYSEDAARRLDAYFRRDGFKPDNLSPPFDVATFKRGWFALPRAQSGTWVLFYNRQAFGQSGVKPPTTAWTWDDFLRTARDLTRPAGGGGGQTTQWGTALEPLVDFFYPWLWGAGGDDIEPTRETSSIDQPPAVEALQWLADLRLKHHVAPPAGELSDPLAAFVAGKVAMWYGPADTELDLNRNGGARPPDFAIAPQPKGRSGQHGGYRPEVMVLSANAQHPDDGWELLQFLVDVETQRLELDNGLWLPQAKSIVGAEEYQQPANPPYDRRPGTPGALMRARSPIILPRGDEMRAVALRELGPVWQGQRSVQDGATSAAQAVNAIIKGDA
jgi:multiple sugar transport system substrate-binding protein